MARRRRRHRGFGYTKATHRTEARISGKWARGVVRNVRAALRDGNCEQAIVSLSAASFNLGKMRANKVAAGGRRDIVRGNPSGLRKLARRVARACAR